MGLFFIGIGAGILICLIIDFKRDMSNTDYEVHLYQMEWRSIPMKFLTFEKFAEDFKKVKWNYEKEFKHSLFGEDYNKNYLHASIFILDGVGCLAKDKYELKKIKEHIDKYIEIIR